MESARVRGHDAISSSTDRFGGLASTWHLRRGAKIKCILADWIHMGMLIEIRKTVWGPNSLEVSPPRPPAPRGSASWRQAKITGSNIPKTEEYHPMLLTHQPNHIFSPKRYQNQSTSSGSDVAR